MASKCCKGKTVASWASNMPPAWCRLRQRPRLPWLSSCGSAQPRVNSSASSPACQIACRSTQPQAYPRARLHSRPLARFPVSPLPSRLLSRAHTETIAHPAARAPDHAASHTPACEHTRLHEHLPDCTRPACATACLRTCSCVHGSFPLTSAIYQV